MKNYQFRNEYIELSQKVGEAIQSVIDQDVTIMDKDMIRIAGTGSHSNLIGNRIQQETAFGRCLLTREIQTIFNKNDVDCICSECTKASDCDEKALICVPILKEDEAIGVIGICSFGDENRKRLIDNQTKYINFLEKMAILLEAKYSEQITNNENQILSDRMESILDTINSGVVLYDKTGSVLYKNDSLIRILSEVGIGDIDQFVEEIRRNDFLQSLLDTDKCVHPCEIAIDILGVKYNLLVTITYLYCDGLNGEVMLTIQNINYFKKQVMQSIEKNQLRLKFDNILGISPNFQEVKKLAEKIALSESNIILQGESGTGKELFARAIHNQSNRRDNAFVPINCGAIPDELFESELFGYEKGAFTGAYSNKIGKFEIADKGTIFLDEISELPYRMQVKLLRILQEKEVSRIGSNIVHKVDIRIIAASNNDLKQKVKDGLFREDLYYRLNVIPITLPPLRERKEDIEYIANHYVKYYSNMLNKNILGFSDKAMDMIIKYNFPGNIRELQNLVEYAVNLETGKYISNETIIRRISNGGEVKNNRSYCNQNSLDHCVNSFEKDILSNVIEKHRSNVDNENIVGKICNELGVSRATLYRKLAKHKLSLNYETSTNNETTLNL